MRSLNILKQVVHIDQWALKVHLSTRDHALLALFFLNKFFRITWGKDHSLEDLDIDWRMILKRILKKKWMKEQTRLIWFRIGTSGGLFSTRKWTFGYHERWGIIWAAEVFTESSRRALMFAVGLSVSYPLYSYMHTYYSKISRIILNSFRFPTWRYIHTWHL
jgi:hypothetical protein